MQARQKRERIGDWCQACACGGIESVRFFLFELGWDPEWMQAPEPTAILEKLLVADREQRAMQGCELRQLVVAWSGPIRPLRPIAIESPLRGHSQ